MHESCGFLFVWLVCLENREIDQKVLQAFMCKLVLYDQAHPSVRFGARRMLCVWGLRFLIFFFVHESLCADFFIFSFCCVLSARVVKVTNRCCKSFMYKLVLYI